VNINLNKTRLRNGIPAPILLSLGLAIALSLLWITSSFAQNNQKVLWQARVIESEKAVLQNPTGLAFSSKWNAFHVINSPGFGKFPSVSSNIIRMTLFARQSGSALLPIQIVDPINITFDNKFGRLLILQFPKNQLLEIREGLDGNLDIKTITRYDITSFELQDPQGISVDPASGTLFILDAAGQRIVRARPGSNGTFEGAAVSKVNLASSGLSESHGLAFDPDTGHLFLVSLDQQMLYDLNQSGKVSAEYDLSKFHLNSPQGMVFAPSGDQTDNPQQNNLYLADSGSNQILEFSLETAAVILAPTTQSSLIRTVNLATVSPPSPDPAGLAYLPLSATLMFSDCEVEEKVNGITQFAGANLWETTLNGSVIRTANISHVAPTLVPMTNEPSGVAWNPFNGHFYFSDDDAYEVYDLNPGADGLVGTSDDTWTSFDTLAIGSVDPEGVTIDTWNNQIYVVDGTNREIYQFTVTGSLVSHFDVASMGVTDPEGVEFNPDSGTLFILSSSSNRVIVETTTSGVLLQTINVSTSQSSAPAGLAYGPASDGSAAMRFYIVDRGIDNNNNPNIIDGKMYEMSVPSSGQSTATVSPSATATKTSLPSATNTVTPSRTTTPTATNTPTRTPTRTSTPTSLASSTSTSTPSRTPTTTSTPTDLASSTSTSTPSRTPTSTPTTTATPTDLASSTSTSTPSNTPTSTPTTTSTPTDLASSTSTSTPSNTPTRTPTTTSTPTDLASSTSTSTPSRTPTSTPTTTSTPTSLASSTSTSTPSNTPTRTPTKTSTPTQTSGNTGFLSPSINAAQSGGDGNGYEVNAGNAYLRDGLFAVDNNSGTGTSSSCTNSGKDKHRFQNYNISLPNGATVTGIQVRLNAKVDSTSGSPKLCVQLSWNGGSNWTPAKSTSGLSGSNATYTLGSPADLWGRAWNLSQFANSNFMLRVINVATSNARDFSLDWVSVQVTYR
jgi:uncharacterized protein YjiK